MAVKQQDPESPATQPRRSGTKGRPKRSANDEGLIHDALLSAADECIASEKTSNVPVRRIAAKAGVNQAMINYYFNNKDGLLLAIFEANFAPLVKKLRDFEKACADPADDTVCVDRLLSIIDRHFENSPALFVLHADMLNEEPSVANTYSEQNGSRGYTTIVRIMQLMMDRGICRTDISAKQAAYMICVLGAVHHVMSPIFDTAFRGLLEGDRTAELGKLARQLLKPC